jgi:hypothetical protein
VDRERGADAERRVGQQQSEKEHAERDVAKRVDEVAEGSRRERLRACARVGRREEARARLGAPRGEQHRERHRDGEHEREPRIRSRIQLSVRIGIARAEEPQEGEHAGHSVARALEEELERRDLVALLVVARELGA